MSLVLCALYFVRGCEVVLEKTNLLPKGTKYKAQRSKLKNNYTSALRPTVELSLA